MEEGLCHKFREDDSDEPSKKINGAINMMVKGHPRHLKIGGASPEKKRRKRGEACRLSARRKYWSDFPTRHGQGLQVQSRLFIQYRTQGNE